MLRVNFMRANEVIWATAMCPRHLSFKAKCVHNEFVNSNTMTISSLKPSLYVSNFESILVETKSTVNSGIDPMHRF
jgi:hypothetical protein